MDGIKFKRAISATLERYTAALGYKVRIVYVGQSAGMNFVNGQLNVIFPAIDETGHFTIADVNRYVGMVIHEGGHAKFTDCKAWDKAVSGAPKGQGKFLHRLINGLEDPRMEQCVIDSRALENSRNLLSDLTNWLLKDGYVEPDDIENVAFICAIEGRRLNGYQLNYPCIVDQSPWSAAIWDALHSARKARNTQGVADAAQTLLDALLRDPQGEGRGKGQDTDSKGSDSTGESQGEGQGQGEGESEGEGKQGEGEQGEGRQGESEDEGKQGKPMKVTPKGQQRSIEPLANVKGDVPVADSAVDRPHVGAPVISEIKLF
jgi:hypothetical protein